MSPGRSVAGRRRALRAILALAAVSACLAAAAYAATRPERPAAGLTGSHPVGAGVQHGAGAPQGVRDEPLLQPRLIEFPDAISTSSEAQFRFHVPPRPQQGGPPSPGLPPSPEPAGEAKSKRRFQCRLDGGGWESCSSPRRLGNLAPGGHLFAVRAFNRADRPGPTVSYSWRQAAAGAPAPVSHPEPVPEQGDPKPFAIEAQGELEDLYPGYPPQQVPVLISNPNPVPIEVTSITIAIVGDSPDCPAENFELSPASVSPMAPLGVPANGSVSLPTETTSAPTIDMLDLPVNQDACRGTQVPLALGGEAHG